MKNLLMCLTLFGIMIVSFIISMPISVLIYRIFSNDLDTDHVFLISCILSCFIAAYPGHWIFLKLFPKS